MMTAEELSRSLYAAYVQAHGGLTPEGKQAIEWEKMTDKDREAWRKVAAAAVANLVDVTRSTPVIPQTKFTTGASGNLVDDEWLPK